MQLSGLAGAGVERVGHEVAIGVGAAFEVQLSGLAGAGVERVGHEVPIGVRAAEVEGFSWLVGAGVVGVGNAVGVGVGDGRCGLESPDVAGRALGPGHSPLVSGGRRAVAAAGIDGRAAGKQSMGLRGAAVISERAQMWVGVDEVGGIREAAGAIAIDVVALGGDRAAAAVCSGAVRHDCVLQGSIGQRGSASVIYASSFARHIAADSAVKQDDRILIIVNTATLVTTVVAANGAVGNRHRRIKVVNAAAGRARTIAADSGIYDR